MAVDAVIGLQRGDEGKGRFVDMLAEDYDIVARFNGGDNAGHTVVLPNGQEVKLHLVPSGIVRPQVVNIIGNGTLVNPVNLAKEFDYLKAKGVDVNTDNLKISCGAQLILPHHISEDEVREAGKGSQGSTKSGIAQASSSKAMRAGARVEMINNDLDGLTAFVTAGLKAQQGPRKAVGLPAIDEEAVISNFLAMADRIAKYETDTVLYLNDRLRQGSRVLAEGAQAFLLDVDHGMSPYTSSSSTTSGGISSGLGIPPHYIEKVFGVAKAVQSHVGGGPFVTEVTDPDQLTKLYGDMKTVDAEVGTTTGRIRRLGHLDTAQIRRANMINGTTEMFLTKLDWIPRYGDKVPICVDHELKGKSHHTSADSAQKLEQLSPVYEFLSTWEENIQEVRKFENLPKNARAYIDRIEELVEVPITKIGVGPRRDQVINR